MKKIIVLGSGGSGKSTFAQKLSQKLGLPLIVLDQHYWSPGWISPPKKDWRNKVSELVKKDQWIMDGNYKSTFDIRFPASDTIIWLNRNRFLCCWRVIKRRLLNDRVDKLDGCNEKVDLQFFKWVLWDYPTKGRKMTREFLRKYQNKKVFILKHQKDIKKFLA